MYQLDYWKRTKLKQKQASIKIFNAIRTIITSRFRKLKEGKMTARRRALKRLANIHRSRSRVEKANTMSRLRRGAGKKQLVLHKALVTMTSVRSRIYEQLQPKAARKLIVLSNKNIRARKAQTLSRWFHMARWLTKRLKALRRAICLAKRSILRESIRALIDEKDENACFCRNVKFCSRIDHNFSKRTSQNKRHFFSKLSQFTHSLKIRDIKLTRFISKTPLVPYFPLLRKSMDILKHTWKTSQEYRTQACQEITYVMTAGLMRLAIRKLCVVGGYLYQQRWRNSQVVSHLLHNLFSKRKAQALRVLIQLSNARSVTPLISALAHWVNRRLYAACSRLRSHCILRRAYAHLMGKALCNILRRNMDLAFNSVSHAVLRGRFSLSIEQQGLVQVVLDDAKMRTMSILDRLAQVPQVHNRRLMYQALRKIQIQTNEIQQKQYRASVFRSVLLKARARVLLPTILGWKQNSRIHPFATNLAVILEHVYMKRLFRFIRAASFLLQTERRQRILNYRLVSFGSLLKRYFLYRQFVFLKVWKFVIKSKSKKKQRVRSRRESPKESPVKRISRRKVKDQGEKKEEQLQSEPVNIHGKNIELSLQGMRGNSPAKATNVVSRVKKHRRSYSDTPGKRNVYHTCSAGGSTLSSIRNSPSKSPSHLLEGRGLTERHYHKCWACRIIARREARRKKLMESQKLLETKKLMESKSTDFRSSGRSSMNFLTVDSQDFITKIQREFTETMTKEVTTTETHLGSQTDRGTPMTTLGSNTYERLWDKEPIIESAYLTPDHQSRKRSSSALWTPIKSGIKKNNSHDSKSPKKMPKPKRTTITFNEVIQKSSKKWYDYLESYDHNPAFVSWPSPETPEFSTPMDKSKPDLEKVYDIIFEIKKAETKAESKSEVKPVYPNPRQRIQMYINEIKNGQEIANELTNKKPGYLSRVNAYDRKRIFDLANK